MPAYLADDIHLVTKGNRRSLAVRCHVCTTALETEALVLSAREFATVCHVACEHLIDISYKHFKNY